MFLLSRYTNNTSCQKSNHTLQNAPYLLPHAWNCEPWIRIAHDKTLLPDINRTAAARCGRKVTLCGHSAASVFWSRQSSFASAARKGRQSIYGQSKTQPKGDSDTSWSDIWADYKKSSPTANVKELFETNYKVRLTLARNHPIVLAIFNRSFPTIGMGNTATTVSRTTFEALPIPHYDYCKRGGSATARASERKSTVFSSFAPQSFR